jgi:hypothetical protein
MTRKEIAGGFSGLAARWALWRDSGSSLRTRCGLRRLSLRLGAISGSSPARAQLLTFQRRQNLACYFWAVRFLILA